MDYDFRNRASSPYDAYNRSSSSASTASLSHPMYGQPLYPRVGQPGHTLVSPGGRHPSYHQSSSHPPPSSSGSGIRVTIKPEYRITPPPQLSSLVGEVPRSKFHFDFDFERKILAEAEKGSQDWSRLGLEHLPAKPAESTPPSGPAADPVVSKYIASGLDREAVPLAVSNYGDNPAKVREFVSGYTLLREMGFSSNNVAEALIMYENDTDKALAHFLNSSS